MRCAIAMAIVALYSVGVGTPALAVDGVVEINQATATAAGGFPYTIASSGSYILTSNLVVTSINTSAILVNASQVSIDLNGFTIAGPHSCIGDGSAIICGPGGGILEAGVQAGFGVTHVAVRNGFIRGLPHGVYLVGAPDSRVENITATENVDDGIIVGRRSAVVGCLSGRNGGSGINLLGDVTDGATVSGNVVQDNGEAGIRNSSIQTTVRGNTSTGNGGDGILGGVNLVENTSRSNGGDGINASGLIANNLVSGNSGDEIETVGSGSTLVIGNTVSSSSPIGSALNLSAQTSFIDDAIKGLVVGAIDVSGNRCNGAVCP